MTGPGPLELNPTPYLIHSQVHVVDPTSEGNYPGITAMTEEHQVRGFESNSILSSYYRVEKLQFRTAGIDPLHIHGNAANDLEDRTIRIFNMRIDLNSQKRKFLLFCPPDWLHSHDVQGVYITCLNEVV